MSKALAMIGNGELAPSFREKNDFQLNCEREFHFALQALRGNNYLRDIAEKNVESLKAAILNVAAVGISLNPAEAYAYLVPRDRAVCLDISWRGLVKLATDSGAIKLCIPELHFRSDEKFNWRNPFQLPIHEFDPSHEGRGAKEMWENLLGGYAITKLGDDSLLCEYVQVADLLKVKNASPSSSKAGSPWNQWPLEMVKKTIIKRAAKRWPQTERLSQAIEVDNQAAAVVLDAPTPTEQARSIIDEIRDLIPMTDMDEAQVCKIGGAERLEDFPDERLPRIKEFVKRRTAVHVEEQKESA